jgi:Protein of unknown function (DUF3500)
MNWRCILVGAVLCGSSAWPASGQQEGTDTPQEPATPTRPAFVSDASHFIGTYQPPFDRHTPEEMAAAGKAFVEALGDNLRPRGALSLDDPERSQWTNLPPRPDDGGVRLGELNDEQLKATCDLMATLLSRAGYEEFVQIMLGDDQLLNGGRRQQGIGTVDFAVMVFGEPSPTGPWAFQLDGHHLGINIAVEGKKYSLSPSFIGAQPEEFTVAGRKYRPFAGEVDDAYALIGLLDDKQRIAAVIQPNRGGLRAGPGQDGNVPEPRGVACSGFNEAQRTALFKLIENWIEVMPPEHAAARREELKGQVDQMHFSWDGAINPRSDMSYCVQGPALIIEFACQGRGDRPLDHLHSQYRDPTNEYGGQ